MAYYLIVTDKGIVTKPVSVNTPAALATVLAAETQTSGKAAAIELTAVADVTGGVVPPAFVAARTNAAALAAKAQTALATNAAYLAQPALPAGAALTTTQLTTAIRVMRNQLDAQARQSNAIIRLLLGALDDVTNT